MKQKNTSNYIYLLIVQILIIMFVLINYVVHSVSMFESIKLFFFQLVPWMVVGYACLSFLCPSLKSFIEVLTLSYAMGIMIFVITYMVSLFMGAIFVFPYIIILESVLAIVYIYKGQHFDLSIHDKDIYGGIVCLFILAVYFLLSLVTVSFTNSMPNETINGTGYHPDLLFWLGNNVSFTKSFPPINFRQVDYPFRYHYFSSIIMAGVSLGTGVDVNVVSLYYSPLFAGILLVFGAYYLSNRVLKNKTLVIVLMIIVLFTDGLTMANETWILLRPFGYDYGCAYGMLTLGTVTSVFFENNRKMYILSLFLLAMTVGCKGPIGFVIAVFCGVTAFKYLVEGEIKNGILMGGGWLASFSAVYFLFMHSDSVISEQGMCYIGSLNLNTIIEKNIYVNEIYNYLVAAYSIEGDSSFAKLLALFLWIFRADYVVVFLLFCALLYCIISIAKMNNDWFLDGMIISSLSGIIVTTLFTQPGGSQTYFFGAIFPVAALSGLYVIDRMIGDKLYRSCGVWLACVFVLLGFSINRYYTEIYNSILEGVAVVKDKYLAEYYINRRYRYADSVDWEAFTWLKDNTEEDSIIAVDSFVNAIGSDNVLIAGVFSERYIWNEYTYVSDAEEASRRNSIIDAMKTDINGSLETMENEGVEYIVSQVVDDKTEYGTITNKISEVFRNKHYIIYRII